MVLLDTNVLSEMRRPDHMHPKVAEWARSVQATDLYLSAISVMEIETGALLLARRDAAQAAVLRAWIDQRVLPTFAGRILAVDTAVTLRCAQLHVPNRRPERDALIAATALVHGMTVATRNSVDFTPMGCRLLNPWDGFVS